MIVVQHPTETLMLIHLPRWCDYRAGLQELVFESLMVSLGVTVRHELRDRMLK